MANKRQLKKRVRYACGDMAAELLVASHCLKGFDRADVVRIVNEIASLQETTLANASFAFDKNRAAFDTPEAYRKARHAYFKAAYKKLDDEFMAKMAEIVKEMNAAMPQAVKDANTA